MVTFARVSKVGIIPTAPRRSEADYTPVKKPISLEFHTEFDSKIDADKLPVDYQVSLNDPSRILTPKDGHIDYAHITETDLHLLMWDIYKGLRKNGRRVVISGNISVKVYD